MERYCNESRVVYLAVAMSAWWFLSLYHAHTPHKCSVCFWREINVLLLLFHPWPFCHLCHQGCVCSWSLFQMTCSMQPGLLAMDRFPNVVFPSNFRLSSSISVRRLAWVLTSVVGRVVRAQSVVLEQEVRVQSEPIATGSSAADLDPLASAAWFLPH